jgi:hypothetical protein
LGPPLSAIFCKSALRHYLFFCPSRCVSICTVVLANLPSLLGSAWGLRAPDKYVSILQHTSAYVSIRQHTPAYVPAWKRMGLAGTRRSAPRSMRRQGDAVAVRIPSNTACVSIRQHTSAYGGKATPLPSACPPTLLASAYVSVRQHTSAYVSIRQHTSAYISIRRQGDAVAVRIPATLQQLQQRLPPSRY